MWTLKDPPRSSPSIFYHLWVSFISNPRFNNRQLGHKKKKITLTAEQCLPVRRQFVRIFQCAVLSELYQVWLMINLCSCGICEFIVLTSILGEKGWHRALPICTPSVPIFQVGITLRTLQDDHRVFLRELWIYYVDLHFVAKVDAELWPSFDYGFNVMGLSLFVFYSAAKSFLGLLFRFYAFFVFIWLNLVDSPPSLEDRFELGERILRL